MMNYDILKKIAKYFLIFIILVIMMAVCAIRVLDIQIISSDNEDISTQTSPTLLDGYDPDNDMHYYL